MWTRSSGGIVWRVAIFVVMVAAEDVDVSLFEFQGTSEVLKAADASASHTAYNLTQASTTKLSRASPERTPAIERASRHELQATPASCKVHIP